MGPSSVTYLPGLTPLPIVLTCNVAGVATWTVNDTDYTLANLTDGELPGHSLHGTNILVLSPVNNTEYICVSLTNDGKTRSDPAYIVIAGKYNDNLGTIFGLYVSVQRVLLLLTPSSLLQVYSEKC